MLGGRLIAAPTRLLNLKLYKAASKVERRARRLGVPSAKRQTVQTNEFVRIWLFLHRRAEVGAPYGLITG